MVGRAKDTDIDLEEPGVFNPAIVLVNDKDLTLISNKTKVVNTAGVVKQSLYYKGSVFLIGMEVPLFWLFFGFCCLLIFIFV